MRVLSVDGCYSDAVHASRGLAAGSVLAMIELCILLLRAGERMTATALYSRITLYVDDATVETACTVTSVVEQHALAVNSFVTDLQGLRLVFSDMKNVICATTNALARAAKAAIEGIKIKDASRATLLGAGLGAGGRRSMLQARKKLKNFIARRSRFKKLKRAGVRTDRLVRTGGNVSMTCGQRFLGGSDSLLLNQRRAAAAACCGTASGANLALSLAVADGSSRGATDPAFEAHCGVVHFWP